ncbi:MAG: glutamate--tRNA ligase [Phaeodactylibacter sp.]|nr:glutamate--tRNA ligase [Phaeodactylibacter sp.]
MEKMRLRFAPSPTGALHIGGVRTALYNYLLAKKHGGAFILRIEDTDQGRFVPGAEDYIKEALEWFGLAPDEGPGYGGAHGPYRQSERKALYHKYTAQLVENGRAYYAFDTPEELAAQREENPAFKYDAGARMRMKNSLTLAEEEVGRRIKEGEAHVVRLKVPTGETVSFRDQVRGQVSFDSYELDDKVLLKADGMPTYHMANVVDDYLMEITHVIRGEEWLSSTAHHVLLYQALGWEGQMPEFAHLPLILRPDGKGKLSKRDGARFGFPVFPLSWEGKTEEDSFTGMREFGFLPEAALNFLALLGWNPGTEQEIFSREELVAAFSVERINKSGTRFDIDKAKWFNQQYIIKADTDYLLERVRPVIAAHGYEPGDAFLKAFIELMRERAVTLDDFWENGYFFFEEPRAYDEKMVRKRWDPERKGLFDELAGQLHLVNNYTAGSIKAQTEAFIDERGLKFGDVLPILRLGVAGTMKGPAIFEMMELLGREEVDRRLRKAFVQFNELK